MYRRPSPQDRQRVDRILSGFTLREKIGQIFCMKVGKMDAGQVAEVVETHALGGIFYAYRHVDETAEITATVNRRAAT